MAGRKSLRTYEVQVSEGVFKDDTHRWKPYAGNIATRGDAVKALAAITEPGKYRVGCFWPPVGLAFAERKMVRTVEPVTKPGHGNRKTVVD